MGAADVEIAVDKDGADGGEEAVVLGDGLIEADGEDAGVKVLGAEKACWAKTMRSTAKVSWELAGW